jgi:hypothetical protein
MAQHFQPPKLINQHEFDKYSTTWLKAVEGEALPHVFQRNGQKLRYVSFPLQNIVWLLSTVGAQRIKAQFLVKNDDECADGESREHFTMAIHATDALNGRISAYYLADNTQLPAPVTDECSDSAITSDRVGQASNDKLAVTSPDVGGSTTVGGQVPHGLAGVWLTNWYCSDAAEPAMFTSNYGPLQGYTFDMEDFRDSLFYAADFFAHPELAKRYEMHIAFGLHEYYSAFNQPENKKRTFGLVVRVYDAHEQTYQFLRKSQVAADNARTADNPEEFYFYDLSTPNPPGG